MDVCELLGFIEQFGDDSGREPFVPPPLPPWAARKLKPVPQEEPDEDLDIFDYNHKSMLIDVLLRELRLHRMDESDILDWKYCRLYGEDDDPKDTEYWHGCLAVMTGLDPRWHSIMRRLGSEYALTVDSANVPDMCQCYFYISPLGRWEDAATWTRLKEMIEIGRDEEERDS